MDGEEKVKPWKWPGEWFRDEKFWRDVGSRGIAGLLVVLVGYLFALAGGYIARPNVLRTVALIVALVIGGVVQYYLHRSARRQMRKTRKRVAEVIIKRQLANVEAERSKLLTNRMRKYDRIYFWASIVGPIAYAFVVVQVIAGL